MEKNTFHKKPYPASALIRKLLLSWLIADSLEYLLVPSTYKNLQELSSLANMSALRVVVLTAVLFCLFLFIRKPLLERWSMVLTFGILCFSVLLHNFSVPLLICCVLIFTCLTCYAYAGWNDSTEFSGVHSSNKKWLWVTALTAVGFFLYVSAWTVCRVRTFSTPTFDFGIFSQMFYNMKTTGLPLTTVERDGLLSHFHVHVSPIYYLLLPFYCIVPVPGTLQVLQASVLASAVIPLWLIGKQRNLSPASRTLLCILLLFYPAYAGGASYDIHENAFLTPLILWLLYAMGRKHILLTAVFSGLLLLVKEDAAVYAAVIALYFLIHGSLKKDHWQIWAGAILAITSILWFLAVTRFLANVGDGVMTYRYQNFMYGDSGSLTAVILSVIMCPMKAVLECVDTEKLRFIALTLLPLLGLPLLTRRYERYILLIPYILINLMSDYQYQHDIFFQYTYGSTACLFYLTAVNLADFKTDNRRICALLAALILCVCSFASHVIPKATPYFKRNAEFKEHYDSIRQTLAFVPEDAAVSATTFYTTQLSQRSVLYDVQYASIEHVLSTEYAVLSVPYKNAYKKYATEGDNGLANLIAILESNGFTLHAQLKDELIIYKKG